MHSAQAEIRQIPSSLSLTALALQNLQIAPLTPFGMRMPGCLVWVEVRQSPESEVRQSSEPRGPSACSVGERICRCGWLYK